MYKEIYANLTNKVWLTKNIMSAHTHVKKKKNEGMKPKQKQYPAVDVTGDRSKVRCFKEQYCIGTWNVMSMKQGKWIWSEMARVNGNIFGISKLKWTGMGEFNSDDHYIYSYGQESLRRNGLAIIVKKESKMQYLDAISFVSKANHSISW